MHKKSYSRYVKLKPVFWTTFEFWLALWQDPYGQIFEEDVLRGSSRKRYFVNKKIVYVWNPEIRNFEKLRNIDENMKQSEFHKCKEGLGQLTVADRFQEYGDNFIKVSVPSVLYLLLHEVSCAT